MGKTIRKEFLVYLLIVAVMPFVLFDEHYRSVLVVTGIYSIVSIGLSLLMGLSGQISLGQAAFWGIGAYTSAVLTTKLGISPFLGLIAAGAVPGVLAFILARAIAGLNGYYLAMATLAFGFVIQIGITQWDTLTGGANGLIGIPPIDFFGKSELGMYYLVWGIATLILLFSLNIMNSRMGRAFRAIHKSEIAATSMGVDVRRYKLSAFVLSGVITGISGGLYAHYVGILDPQPFGFHESILFITMVVVGGMSSIWGAVIGSVIVHLVLSEGLIALSRKYPDLKGDVDTIVFGVILILIVLFMPQGLVPRFRSVYMKYKIRKAEAIEQKTERGAAA